jgi:hypothetical protein
MLQRSCWLWAAVLGVTLGAGSLHAALTDSLTKGTPEVKSIGALAFGPEGILFLGDARGAAIIAVDTGDRPASPATGAVKIDGLDEKIASLLGTTPKDVQVNDIAVNPLSGKAYLSVNRGKAPNSPSVLLRVDRTGKIEEFPLRDVKFAKAELPKATDRNRQEAITQIQYVKGQVIVAGLANEEFASRLRSIPFPFEKADAGAGIRIFHGAHGRFETNSPVRTFVPYDIAGETYILAAYTCTPLVKIPVSELKPGAQVQGVTVAELGNRNKPLDMVVYKKDGKDYILMANSSRGVMKVTTENIDKIAAITEPVRGGKAGLTYDTIDSLKGVEHLARADNDNALLLIRTPTGSLNLETVALP